MKDKSLPPTGKDRIVTSIILSRDMHRQLAIAAAEEGVPNTELLRQIVGAWLNQRSRRSKRERRNP